MYFAADYIGMRVMLILLLIFFIKTILKMICILMVLSFFDSRMRLFLIKKNNVNYVWELPQYTLLPNSIGITKILFYFYELQVFNLAYFHLSFSYKSLLNFFTWIRLLWFLLYYFFDISRLLVKGIILIYYKKSNLTWENYLWLKLNDTSERKIIYFEDLSTFCLNGKEFEAHRWTVQFINDKNLSFNDRNEFIARLNHLHTKSLMLKEQSTAQYSSLKINSKWKHEINLEIAKSRHHVGMLTDYAKATKNNFYDKEYIVEKFQGKSKLTTMIAIEKRSKVNWWNISKIFFRRN